MKKIKIARPKYQIPIDTLLKLYRKELGSYKLKTDPSKENIIIEENKKFFNHIGIG